MKAAYVLLCVVLARETAGHIFRRQHYQPMDQLIVQPLDYINQVEALYPQQRTQESRNQDETWQVREYPQKYSQQKEQYDTQRENQQYNQKDNQQSNEQYYKKENQQQYYQKDNQKYNQQYSQQNVQQYQYEEQARPQYTQQKKEVKRPHDSTSVESNSQEEIERINKYAMPMYADVTAAKTRLYQSQSEQNEMRPMYGDAITWRGVKIAASPRTAVEKEDIEKIFGEAYKTMQHVSSEDQKIFHQNVEKAVQSNNPDVYLNTTELLNKYQYPVETHIIKTDDGYFLTLFRIPAKDQTLEQRPVVFLMHGLLGSSDDWLLMGPGISLAYLLADAGYEVWLGNARGNRYSRRHVSKHPALADFWQFSNDEIALYDLPAMIDYALKTSNQQKLYYVGHSQGTTAFFALAATRPEYNEKVIMMYALSPMVYMSSIRSPLLRMMSSTSPLYERLHAQLGHGEFKPSKELIYTVGGSMLETEIGCKNVSSNVNFVMSGVNVNNLDVEMIPVIMGHLPAGGSTRQMKQYAQGVASHEFTKYDFGAQINERVYGSRLPPKYEMEKVRTPVALYYSEEDWLAHPNDVSRLERELPIVQDSYQVPNPHFTHMDFQFSKNAPEVVYNRLIASIQKHSQQNYY